MADPRLFGEPNRAMVKLRWWRTWVKEPRHMMMRTCALCPRLIFSHWDLENLMLGPIIAGAMNRLGLNGRMSCMSNSIWIKAEA